MRTLTYVEKRLAEARAMAENAPPSYDNTGRMVRTAAENRRVYALAVTRLEAERDSLLRVLGRG